MYSIRPVEGKRLAESLWIHVREISFTGRINVVDGWMPGWKAGIIQSIYKSERNGHYENGAGRLFRLNTGFGPLKDGMEDELFYVNTAKDLKPGLTTVSGGDEPNFELPLVMNGNKLLRTEGEDQFCSFLAIARESDKSVVILSSIAWDISWDGQFTFANRTWVESRPGGAFVADQAVLRETAYLNLKENLAPADTPFSLFNAEAETFAEIDTGGQWLPCSMSGNIKKAQPVVLNNWTGH